MTKSVFNFNISSRKLSRSVSTSAKKLERTLFNSIFSTFKNVILKKPHFQIPTDVKLMSDFRTSFGLHLLGILGFVFEMIRKI